MKVNFTKTCDDQLKFVINYHLDAKGHSKVRRVVFKNVYRLLVDLIPDSLRYKSQILKTKELGPPVT